LPELPDYAVAEDIVEDYVKRGFPSFALDFVQLSVDTLFNFIGLGARSSTIP